MAAGAARGRAASARDVLGRTRGPLSGLLNLTGRKRGGCRSRQLGRTKSCIHRRAVRALPALPRWPRWRMAEGAESRWRFPLVLPRREIGAVQTGPGAVARRAALAVAMALPPDAALGWPGQSRGQRGVGDGAIGVTGSGGSERAASALRGEGGNASIASVRLACAWSSRPDVPVVAAFF